MTHQIHAGAFKAQLSSNYGMAIGQHRKWNYNRFLKEPLEIAYFCQSGQPIAIIFQSIRNSLNISEVCEQLEGSQ